MTTATTTFLSNVTTEITAIITVALTGLGALYGGLIGIGKLFKWAQRLVGSRA